MAAEIKINFSKCIFQTILMKFHHTNFENLEKKNKFYEVKGRIFQKTRGGKKMLNLAHHHLERYFRLKNTKHISKGRTKSISLLVPHGRTQWDDSFHYFYC